MLAKCRNPKCGIVFNDTKAINISNAFVHMSGNTIDCPRCGSRADFLEGDFYIDQQGIVTLLSGPQFTYDVLKQLRDLTENAAKKNFSQEEFLQKAEEINPTLGFLRNLLPKDWQEIRSYIYPFLLALLAALFQNSPAPQNTVINNNTTNVYKTETVNTPKKVFVPKQRKPNSKKSRLYKYCK